MWRAQYREAGPPGKPELVYECDVKSHECPVAAIREESLLWIEQVGRARRVFEATGGVMMGPDASQWPPRYFDAVEVVEGELMAESVARAKAFDRR